MTDENIVKVTIRGEVEGLAEAAAQAGSTLDELRVKTAATTEALQPLASRSNEFVAALQRQAATLGMSKAEARMAEIGFRDLSEAEKRLATEAVATINAHEAMTGGLRTLGMMAAAAGLALAGLATAGAKGVFDTIGAADEVGKLSQRLGMATESLTALQFGGRLAGVSMEQMGQAVRNLSNRMQDAARGGAGAQSTFSAIGVSVREANGDLRSADQVLADVADRFQGYRDGAEKTALAVDLFGRAGERMIPMLNQGSAGLQGMAEEARAFGVVFGNDLAKKAEQFNDNLTRMRAAFDGVRLAIASDMLPALVQLTNQLVEGRRAAGGFLEAFKLFGTMSPFKTWGEHVASLRKEIAGLEADRDRQLRFGAGASATSVQTAIDAARKRMAFAQEQYAAEVAERHKASYSNEGRTPLVAAPVPPAADRRGTPRAGRDWEFEFQATMDRLSGKDLAAVQKDIERASEALQRTLEATAAAEWKQAEAVAADTRRMQEQLDVLGLSGEALGNYKAQKLLTAAAAAEMAAEGNREQAALLEEADAASELARLHRQLAAARAESAGALRDQASIARDTAVKQEGIKLADEAKRQSERMSQDLTQALMRGFEGGKRGAEALRDTVKHYFASLVLEPLIRPIMQPIAAKASGIGNALAGLFSSDGGSSGGGLDLSAGRAAWDALSGVEIPSFDVGTDFVPRDTLAMVHRGERIVPAAQNRGGGGTVVQMPLTVNIDSRTDAASVRAYALQAAGLAERRLAQSLRTGGTWATAMGRA